MTFFGVGDQDWVELDLDDAEHAEIDGLIDYLTEHRDRIESEIGPFDIQLESQHVVLVVGRRSYRAQLDRSGRVMFTGILDPGGPL